MFFVYISHPDFIVDSIGETEISLQHMCFFLFFDVFLSEMNDSHPAPSGS